MMSTKPDPKEVGLRLRAVLRKLGLSIEDAAAQLHEGRANFGNCVNGYQLLRPEVAYALERMLPGLMSQWLYFGDDRLVPAQLARELTIFVEGFRERLWREEPVPSEPQVPAKAPARAASRRMARA